VQGGRDRVVIDISSVATAAEDAGPVKMEPGDIVHVFAVADRVRDRIAVTGDVWSPGAQGFTAGMKITDALKAAGGVKADAYLGDILVTRTRPDSTRVQLRAMLRDTSGIVNGDFPLQEDDEVRVFSVSEFRPKRFVAITGSVRKPGRYAYREGMTMRDLILLAGGMRLRGFRRSATRGKPQRPSAYRSIRATSSSWGRRVASMAREAWRFRKDARRPTSRYGRMTMCSSCDSPTGRYNARWPSWARCASPGTTHSAPRASDSLM
jgi:protein involved in polysaccharide export with SLBB domain